ncbi:MAG: hypothetical protein ACEQSR_03675 [Candidatus Methylacidiphilales bacterium]
MELSKKLLFTEEEFGYNSILNGTSIKGSYSTMQFVLRLRDDVRAALNNDEQEYEYERIQATSTSIHENIHWWQHVGSNFGFMFSLAYPAFAHISMQNFENIINQGLLHKSIIKFDEQYYAKNGIADILDINNILNNYYDFENFKSFTLDNKNIKVLNENKRFFLNIGHCFHTFWSSIIETIAQTIDQDYKFLPAINDWVENFILLEKNKSIGFFVGTPTHISPIGIKAIFEGQAMYNQMQYLTVTLNKHLTYSDFEKSGLIYGIYAEAFDLFLDITKLERPENLLDSIIGLFLLVCDLSINPNNGFPLEIYDYKEFITKNDPGIRFTKICSSIAENSSMYIQKIKYYSKDEYVKLSKELSEKIGCVCPYESISAVLNWGKEKEVAKILSEETECKFSEENLPIRLMFSKYFRFQEDKQKYPNVFCWFGFHSTTENPNVDFEIVDSLFKKHHALIIDDYNGEIKATIFENIENENIMNTFNLFYAYNILYDLTLKWVSEEGEFRYDYKWLAGDRAETFIPTIKANFKRQFGIEIETINLL